MSHCIYYYAECHYVECRYAECHIVFTIMLNVIMLNVVMLSVLAPENPLQRASTSGGHNKAPRPDCLVGLPALFCTRAISACSSKWIFVAATNSYNKNKAGDVFH